LSSDYIIRVAALSVALQLALQRLAEMNDADARLNLEAVRNDAIEIFKNADVPPELDLQQAIIVGPAIDILEEFFEISLESLPAFQ
jgi:hypothetical protein